MKITREWKDIVIDMSGTITFTKNEYWLKIPAHKEWEANACLQHAKIYGVKSKLVAIYHFVKFLFSKS